MATPVDNFLVDVVFAARPPLNATLLFPDFNSLLRSLVDGPQVPNISDMNDWLTRG